MTKQTTTTHLVLTLGLLAPWGLPGQEMPTEARPETNKGMNARMARPARATWFRAPRTVKLAGEPEQPAPRNSVRIGAANRQLSISSVDQMTEDMLPDGRQVLRVAVQSEGAYGTRLRIAGLAEGEGRIWVYSSEESNEQSVYGPYEGTSDPYFWTDVVAGAEIILEFQPAEPIQEGALPFEVNRVAHIFSMPNPAMRNAIPDPKAGFRSAEAEGESCDLDSNCSNEFWRHQTHAVGWLLTPIDEEYWSMCTGTLMNNVQHSFRPYLLTANHCIAGHENTVKSGVVIWNNETLECNGLLTPQEDFVGQRVSQLLVRGAEDEGDFALLLLGGDTPRGLLYAGWTANVEVQPGEFVVGIHHPRGEFKRISAGSRGADKEVESSDHKGNTAVLPTDRYYIVQWGIGRTDGGSSGSAIFNRNGQVVGTLTAGVADCDGPWDAYGRFRSYFPKLARFLVDDDL